MASDRSRKVFRLASLAAGAQAGSPPAPEIAITGIDAWAIRSSPKAAARLVIAVRTSAGVTGYGETAIRSIPASAAAAVGPYADALAGTDAMASMAVWVMLSVVPAAIRGAVDIALLDIRGKVVSAPIYDLFAGRTRDKARAMASLRGNSEQELAQQLAVARQHGFRAFSVPVPLHRDDPTRGRAFFAATEAMLGRLRRAGATDLVLDCAGRASASEAAGLAARLEAFHLLWIDEPTDQISDANLKKISHESVTPVGWGRSLTTSGRFQDLLRMQVIDVLRPDIGLHGISGIRRLASLAEAYYTAVAPFHRGGPIGTAAALQVAASIPNFVLQEVAFTPEGAERRMHEAIAGTSLPQVTDGFFELPTGPGLGITIDEAALQEYSA